jgi:hypothetical protein
LYRFAKVKSHLSLSGRKERIMIADSKLAPPSSSFTLPCGETAIALDRACEHRSMLSMIAPVLRQIIVDGLSPENLRPACPDCWRVLDIRLWQPEAGGWYLKLREGFAAGRKWTFRYNGQTFVAVLD